MQTARWVCDLPISSERVADAFAGLSEQEKSILILRLVLDLTDSEIGEAVGGTIYPFPVSPTCGPGHFKERLANYG